MSKSQGCAISRTGSYSAKCAIQNYSLVWRRHVGVQQKYTNMAAANEWQRLEFTLAISNAFFSFICRACKHSHVHFSYHFGCSDLKNTGWIAVFMYVTRFSAATLRHALRKKWNSNCSIFKTKHATELKTCKQVYFQYVFNAIKIKTQRTLY